jgi:hypothetical protein
MVFGNSRKTINHVNVNCVTIFPPSLFRLLSSVFLILCIGGTSLKIVEEKENLGLCEVT